MRRILSLPLVALALVAAGCGGDREEPAPPASAGAPTREGGLSIKEALASELEGPLLVRGVLLEVDGMLRLCSAVLESDPPQCGEPSLAVEGLDPAQVEEGEQASLLGEVEDGVLAVSQNAQA